MRTWLLVLLAVAHSTAFAEQRYALVIGANPGWSADRPLRYAENDAERVRDVLVSLGGFAPDRVVLLRDPDTQEVRASLRDLARIAQNSTEETFVFVYYSGHADDQRLHLKGEPLAFSELQQTLRAVPATIKVAVLDTCKSGAVTRKGGARVDEFAVTVDNPKLSGMVILTSSGADELSQESRSLAGSVFTHHFVSGLRGAADQDNDKQVTLTEAYHYAYTRTRADTAPTGVPQRPGFRYELTGQGELVLAQLKQPKTARVTLPKGNAGKYVVLDSREWRLIAEARGERDREVSLALAPGSYRIKRFAADHLDVGSLVLGPGDKALVDSVVYQSAPLSQGVVKGNPAELTEEERHLLAREQAFGLLAGGQANAALNMFDLLVRESPADVESWRGRARALIRIAEAYQRVNDPQRERTSLADALKADPTLTNDPMFALRYQHLTELDGRAQAANEAKLKLQAEVRQNPRTAKTWGVGIDLLSARGFFTVDGYLVLKHMLIPRISLDIADAGIDAGLVVAPLPFRWSPFLGIGGHISARKMGIPIGPKPDSMDVNAMVNGESYSQADLFGLQGRAEFGIQFVGRSGFTTEIGIALLTYKKASTGQQTQSAWPIFHFGWVW